MRKRSNDSRIGLYRPGMSSPFRRKHLTVGREAILRDTLDHLRSDADRKSKHHFLFLGPRGIGKSHLLAIIEDGIGEDPRLAPRMIVARFPEESIGTLSFADLLTQLVSILAERITDEPQWKELRFKLDQVHDSDDVIDLVVPVLRRTNVAKKRTVVVMIENLNELFSKQIRQDQQIGAIRKFFMDKNGCLLIATAPMHFDAITDIAQPFYDFFDTQTLQPFDKEQSVTLLKQMRDLDRNEDENSSKEMSHCVMALHDLTGGNPRLMVMTCELIVHEGIESAKEILLRLVDSISPTYQASLAEMAPQERALMETLAAMRDTTTKTPANIASRLGISERQTSSLLKRLTDARLVTFETNPDDKRSRSYCIRDGFFDIWLAVQAAEGSSRRVTLAADFLASFYRQPEGPYRNTGTKNAQYNVMDNTDPELTSSYTEGSHRFLRFAQEQIESWVANRSGNFEQLSSEVISIYQIASNKAIGEWFIGTTIGRGAKVPTEPVDIRSTRSLILDGEASQQYEILSDFRDEQAKNESHIQAIPIVQRPETTEIHDNELNHTSDATGVSESDHSALSVSTHPNADHSRHEFDLASRITDYSSAVTSRGTNSIAKSHLGSSISNGNLFTENHANILCELISRKLEESSLTQNTIQNAIEYREGREWLANGAMQAKPKLRRRLLIRLANALLLDSEEERIPGHGLDDALILLELADRECNDSDLELDALTLATRLMVDYLRGDNRKSLDALKAIDHPIAFANRVRLLFLRGQVDEAFELVHHNKLHVRWAEIAAAIYARCERMSDAIEICQSMRNRGVEGSEDLGLVTIRYFRCLMLVADEFCRRKLPEGRIRLDFTTKEERKQLSELLDLLGPIVSKVFGAGRISNGIELRSLEIAFNAAYIMGDPERSTRIAQLLASASPISRRVPQAIHAGYLKADVDTLNRLKIDWPNNIGVSVSVCELAAFELNDSEFALSEIDALAKSRLNDDQKSALATVLLSVYQLELGELKNKAFSLLANLVGADHFFLRMAEAVSAMDKKDWSLAERLLNERSAPDDPEWLSLHATILQRKGDLLAALEDLKTLCAMTSSPSVLRQAVTVALKIEPRETKFAVEVLERLSRFPTERKNAERMLAEISWETGTDEGLQRASQLYKKLYRESPNEPDLAKNAAICFRRLSELDQSIALLQDLERDHPEFIDGFLLHADLLETQTRAEDAFALLDEEPVRTRFWDKLEFLHKYLHLGYMTDHELEAHRAMCQIGAIEIGKPEPEKTLQAKNLDQLVEFIKGRGHYSEQIDEMVVRGQAPWTMHPFQEHTPLLFAWAYRTQKLVPWETLSGRAHFSTYASNAFYSKANDDGERQLAPIEASKVGEAVVGDISALITLFKLGLLEKAADYFGTIYLPATYRELELFEAKRLQPHQLSRVEQSHRLFEMMVRGQLRRPGENQSETEVIDFQTEADPKSFSVGDVALWLKQSGHVSNNRYKELTAGQSFIVSGRQGIESLLVSKRCLFTLSAIQTLESAGLLVAVAEQYRVILTAAAVHELEQEQFAYEQQSRTARESREFWRIIRDNSKFQFAGLGRRKAIKDPDDDAEDDETDESFRLTLSSFDLAKERGLPLIADDRVLLSIAHNDSDGRPCLAFSTLELLSPLEHHGTFSLDDRLQYALRLIDWRFRFLKIDAQVLKHAAKLTLEAGNTPGIHLTKIARYVQDCMLDVGLFGGDENVTPRRSMALELYAYWTRTVARFVNQLWTDDIFTDEISELLTRWAIDNLLPTVPVSVRADVQIGMAENQAKLMLIHILSDRGANPNTTRSAKLMGVLQEALQMPQPEFCRTVFSLVELDDDDGEGTGLSQEKWSQFQQVFRRGIAKHALAPFHHDGGYQVEARGIALLEASKSLRVKPSEQEVPDHVLNVLKDFTNEHVLKSAPPGPLVFHREPDKKTASVFEATDLLIHPISNSREAVVSYFSELAIRSKNTVSERLKNAIREQSKRILKKRAVNWYPAAEDLMEAIENDWQLNLAGFRQVLLTKNQEWIHRYWYRCIRPRFHPANTLPTSAFHACTDPHAMKERVLLKISENAEKLGILDAYCDQLGHLPLVDNWSLSHVIHRTSAYTVSTDEIFKLAGHDNYLYAYHGCVALVAQWQSLDKDQQTRAAKLLSDFICLSRDQDLQSRRGRFWACMNRLANHFIAWIPLYGPELGDDNSASLAWWMAERLTEVIIEDVDTKTNPKAHVEFVLERNIEPLVHTGFAINQLIRGGATSSVFHSNTNLIQHGGPFFASLIASLKLQFIPIYALLSKKAASEVDSWMFVNTMHQPVGLPQQGSLLFGTYVSDIQTATEQWEIAIDADQETQAAFAQLRSDCRKLTDTDSLEELLSNFGSLSVEDQSMWLDRMKTAVWRQAIPLDPVLSLLRNSVRGEAFVRSMKLDQLSMAIELMLSIQQFGGETWKHELPHRLVDWLDYVESLEEKALVFNGIVCSAIAGESPAAIDRVRERDDFVQLTDAFGFQEDRIESARTVVPRWTWSKLRIYLDRLRAVKN